MFLKVVKFYIKISILLKLEINKLSKKLVSLEVLEIFYVLTR